MSMMRAHIFICFCFADPLRMSGHASRIQYSARKLSERDGVNETSNVAMKGQLLRARYRLDEYLHSHSRARPGESFPSINSSRRAFSGVEDGGRTPSVRDHLGTGSFGDVWKAYDTVLQKVVAVKIYYQGNRYMTWLNADSRGRQELKDSARECTLIQKILDNREKYPIGASRICECYKDYINDAKGTNNVVFLVQEMCGANLKKSFLESNRKAGTLNFHQARVLTKQMIQGIAFLQMFDPPLIHHDLKPENVCLNDKGHIKIIDWGATVHGTMSDMFKGAPATPLYMAPETKSRVYSFVEPWWSYDSYALGIMHMEMVCPMITPNDFYYQVPLSRSAFSQLLRRRCPTLSGPGFDDDFEKDLDIMASLANAEARKRPEPMTFLNDPKFATVVTPQVEEDEAPKLLIFKVGEAIEYWSTTWNQWKPGVIGAVHVRSGLYDLLFPGAFARATYDVNDPSKRKFLRDDWMKFGANADQVRKPEDALRASVSDEFIVRKSVPDININVGGIEASGMVRLGEKPEAAIVHIQRHVRDRLTGTTTTTTTTTTKTRRRIRVPPKAQPKELPTSIDIELLERDIKSYLYPTKYSIAGYVRCIYGATCEFLSANVQCGYGESARQYPGTVKRFSEKEFKASVNIPRDKERRDERSCRLEVVALVTQKGKTEPMKSFQRYLSF